MALKALQELSDEEFKLLIDSVDTIITDCDCVLWLDDVCLPGSPKVINGLKAAGKNVFYMTNNSTRTREQYVDKCKQLGYNASKEEIISTAYLAALYLHQLGFRKRAYIVGPAAIAEELVKFNIDCFGCGPDLMESDVRTFQKSMKLEKDVGAVVVGYDEHISYPKIAKAFAYLQDKNCLFIATNNDPDKKTKNPLLKFPGTGCIVEPIRVSTMREPICMGKPDVFMQKVILSNPKVNPHRTLMVGDKPSTDILLGKRCGFKTLMVLSGSTTLQQVKNWKQNKDLKSQELVPDFYIPTLGNLVPQLTSFYRL